MAGDQACIFGYLLVGNVKYYSEPHNLLLDECEVQKSTIYVLMYQIPNAGAGHMMLISIHHFRFRKYFVRFLLFLPRLFFGKDCFREADRSPGNHSLPPSNRNSLRRSSMRRRDSSRTTLSKRVSI